MSPRPHPRLASVVALTAVTVAAVVSCSRLFSTASFYPPLLAAALGGHLLAALTRRSGSRLAAPIMLVVGLIVCVNLALSSATTYGLPTPATFSALGDALHLARTSLSQVVAPTAPTTGYVLATTTAFWLAAWTADRLAFRFAAPIEALAPAVTIFLFGTVLAGPAHRTSTTALFALTVLGYVVVQRTTRLEATPGTLRAGPADRGWSTIRSGSAMAVVVVVLGLGTVHVAPALARGGLVKVRSNRSDDAPRSVVSPLVDIRARLIDQRNQELFTVSADQPAYWRLMALDDFDGTVWSSNQHFRSAGRSLTDGPTTQLDAMPTTKVSATFALTELGGPWAPAPFRAESVQDTSDLLWDATGATLIVRARRGDVGGLQYRVHSAVPTVTAARASHALGSIPDVVAQADLELPSDFPPELSQLAAQITDGKDSAYAKAKALQSYFRDGTFRYSTDVPPGQDTNAIVDFLRRRTGYCEQFAGTFAALGRAVGLPTRVAVGFTPGDPVAGRTDTYAVFGRNAHAWPEVYLPGLGWLPFEPTPGRGNPGSTSYTGVDPEQAAPGDDPNAVVPSPTVASATTIAPAPPTTAGGPVPTLAPAPAVPAAATPSAPTSGPSRPLLISFGALLLVAAFLVTGPLLARRRRTRRRRAATTPAAVVRVAWVEALEAWVPRRLVRHPADTDLDLGRRLAARLAQARADADLSGVAHRLAALASQAAWDPASITDGDAAEADALGSTLTRQATDGLSRVTRLQVALDPRPPRLQSS